VPKTDVKDHGALQGIRVLELGSFIAGPYAGQQFGDLGAEVIKIERPGRGDPMRHWRDYGKGDLWWPSLNRNKKLVAINLESARGRDIVKELAGISNVLLENFKPGTLERFGLAPEALWQINPGLVIVRISGYGQSGPFADLPGFGSIGEAMGGIRHLTGWPGMPSARINISLGDQITSLFAVIGGLAALRVSELTGVGQIVDAALYESVFALMESTVAEYEIHGIVRNRSGSKLPGIAPSNVYTTKDGTEVLIAANSDPLFERLCECLGIEQIINDERFNTHLARGKNGDLLDRIIEEETLKYDCVELIQKCRKYGVPVTKIYTAEDFGSDEQYLAREMIQHRVLENIGEYSYCSPVPKLSLSRQSVRSLAGGIGRDTEDVLKEMLGYKEEEMQRLRSEGIIEIENKELGSIRGIG